MQDAQTKSEPLVSVIVPCYNNEKYVEQTILSLVGQSYGNIELIVIDDGSSDGTRSRIEGIGSICRRRFTRFHFVSKENEGVGRTLNRGIQLITGEYLCVCDADDVYTPDRIKVLMEVFTGLDDTYALVCGDADFIDENGRVIYRDLQGKASLLPTEAFFYKRFVEFYTRNMNGFDLLRDFGMYHTFFDDNYIPSMCTIMKTKAVLNVGCYTPGIVIEDLCLWLKLSKRYKMKYVNAVVAHYRLHGQNAITVLKDPILLDTIKLLRQEKDYCFRHDLIAKWCDKYSSLLYMLLKRRKFKQFVQYMHPSVVVGFLWWALKRMVRRLR